MRIGIILLCLLSLSFGQITRTHKLNWATDTILVDSICARKIKVSNTPKPISTDSVLTKFPDGTIGIWPISAISTDTSFTDSSLWADSSRASYKSDTSAGALRLGGKTKAYYDTVGAGWIRDSLANKLCLHCVADSAGGAARLGGKTLSQIDTIGHGAIKQSIRDTASNKLWIHGKADSSVLADSVKKNLAISKITGLSDSLANKLPLHGVADSAKGARYLGGKTKTYYDTVGNGGMNAAIALKLNISDTSIFSRDGHGHDTGDLSGLPNFDYFVQGSSSTRTTDAADTDVNSYSKSGFYRASSAAPNLPTVSGYSIIHTNYTSEYAWQLASRRNSNNLFYRVKDNDTWRPWVELWHAENFNPADYVLTTDPRLSDARTPTAHASTHLYNGGDAIVGNEGFGLRAVATDDAWSVAGGLAAGGIGIISDLGRWRQAITFTDAGADSHPVFSIITSKNTGSTWSNVFKVSHSGSGIFKGDVTAASMHVGDKLTLAVDGSGHATVSTKEYGDDIKIKTGGNGSVIDMKDLSTSISSRDVTVSSSYQTKVKSSGTVQIEGGSGITLDCTGSNSVITANKRMTVKRLNYGERQNIYLTSVDDVHWIDADTLTSSYLYIDLIHDSLAQYGIGDFGIKNAKIGDVFIIEMDNRYTSSAGAYVRFAWKYTGNSPPSQPDIPYWHKYGWRKIMAICRNEEGGSTGHGDYGSEFIVFLDIDDIN